MMIRLHRADDGQLYMVTGATYNEWTTQRWRSGEPGPTLGSYAPYAVVTIQRVPGLPDGVLIPLARTDGEDTPEYGVALSDDNYTWETHGRISMEKLAAILLRPGVNIIPC